MKTTIKAWIVIEHFNGHEIQTVFLTGDEANYKKKFWERMHDSYCDVVPCEITYSL